MRFYWRLKSIPELVNLMPIQRRWLWQRFCWYPYRHWQMWVATAGFVLLFMLPVILLQNLVLSLGSWLGRAIPLMPLLGLALFRHMQLSLLRPYMRKALDERICKQCGYWLIGLTEPRCPECGTPFDPELLKRLRPDGEPRKIPLE